MGAPVPEDEDEEAEDVEDEDDADEDDADDEACVASECPASAGVDPLLPLLHAATQRAVKTQGTVWRISISRSYVRCVGSSKSVAAPLGATTICQRCRFLGRRAGPDGSRAPPRLRSGSSLITVRAPEEAKDPMSNEATPTKFATFLKDKKVDTRRILTASHQLESFKAEDRTIRLGKRQARNTEGDKKAPADSRETRSGRPVTPRALEAALSGKSVSGPAKTRLLRAVNAVLEQKKLEKVELRTLF